MNRRGFLGRAGALLAASAAASALPLHAARAETDDERLTRLLDERTVVRGETFNLTRDIVLPDRPGEFLLDHCQFFVPGGLRWPSTRGNQWFGITNSFIDVRTPGARMEPGFVWKNNILAESVA